MRLNTVSKAAFSTLIIALAALFLEPSVPVGTPDTSIVAAPVAIEHTRQAAKPITLQPIKSAKKYTKKFTTAHTAASKTSDLLPVVQHSDIKARHQELANNVLRALPPHCRTFLKNFYVQYVDVKQRGLGGKTTIIIDGTAPDSEFAGLLIHECGHVTHANLQGSSTSGESAFRDGKDIFYNDSPVAAFFAISWSTESVLQKGTKKTDFVSGYAQSDAFEDFAETFAMYILHRPVLKERAKTNKIIAAKLSWMETYLPLNENVLGESTYKWNKTVPWDITKLPFVIAKN